MLKNGNRKIMVFVFYNKAIAFLQERKPCMSSKNPAIHSLRVPKFRLRCSRQCSLELHGVRACTVQSACVARSKPAVWCDLGASCGKRGGFVTFFFGINFGHCSQKPFTVANVFKAPTFTYTILPYCPHGLGKAVPLRKVFLASGYSPKGQCDLSVPRQDVSHTGSRTHCLFPSCLLSLSRLSPFLPTG